MADSYGDDDIRMALESPRRTWDFQYRILDAEGKHQFDARVSSGSISNSDLAQIKRTAKFGIYEGDAVDIDFSRGRIQPVARLLMPDGGWAEWPLGVFLMSSPTQKHVKGLRPDRQVDAFDNGKVLRDDLVTDRFHLPKNTNYTTAIRDLLESAGLNSSSVSSESSKMTNDMEWDPGTSKYAIINALLTGINYASLSFDGNGNPVAIPYRSPADAPVLYRYRLDPNSVVKDSIDSTLDLGSTPNVFVLYVSSPEAGSQPMRSVYTNDNPDSPTSTVSLGRNIVQYSKVDDVADQATLDAAAKAAAESASQVYNHVEFKSGLMPIHTTADVIEIDWGDGGIRYRETDWEMDLKPGGDMSHKVRRVVTV